MLPVACSAKLIKTDITIDWTTAATKVDPKINAMLSVPGCSAGFLPKNFHQSGKKVFGPNHTAPMIMPASAARPTARKLISMVEYLLFFGYD
jgi:methionyl-tRNA formyltransferase